MSTAKSFVVAAVFGVVLPSVASAQQPQPDRSAKFYVDDHYAATKLAEGVYVLTLAHRGGQPVSDVMQRDWRANVVLSVGKDDVFMVDTTYAVLVDKLQAAMAGITTKPVRTLVLTHSHGDHTGAIATFNKQGVWVVAHPNVLAQMTAPGPNGASAAVPPAGLPNVLFDSEMVFYVNDDKVRVFHVPPAHTSGDSIAFFEKANTVAMGDVFFNGMYPVVPIELGASIQGMIGACDRVLGMIDDNTKVVPGHGPVANKAGLKTYRDNLEAVSREVAALVKEGKDEKQVLAAHPKSLDLPTWQPHSRMTTERFVQALFDDATGKNKSAPK